MFTGYMVEAMTENKRYYIGNGKNCTICDSNQGGSDFYNMLTQFEAVDRLNEQEELINRLKKIREEQIETILKLKRKIQELETENKQLIKEWFESEKGYIIESYHDNAIRRDEKIHFLKEEFKERFGDVE